MYDPGPDETEIASTCLSSILAMRKTSSINIVIFSACEYPSEASSLSAKIYGLDIVKKNIENESGNLTRFLVMGKNISQPELGSNKYITSFLFKLKSKPAALYQSLGGFAINGVNLTKLQSYPEKNTFDSFFFLCDLDGHIEDPKVQKSLEELGLHCEDFHVLGVFEADKLREKKK